MHGCVCLFLFFFYIGSANPMLSNQEVSEANRFVKALIALNSKPLGAGMYVFSYCGVCFLPFL